MTSTYWKFRAELADRPGGLAAAASAIAELGANILDVDVHLIAADRVADDMTVELAYWNEPGAVEHALLSAGAARVSGRRLDPHSLVDGPARALDLATRLVASGATDAELVDVLATQVDADRVWLGPPPGPAGDPLGAVALADQRPKVGREALAAIRGDHDGKVWVAAIPWGPGGQHVACLARRTPRFSATEVARAQALLNLAAAVRGARRSATVVGDR
jgi:hypothetical protein